MKDSKGNSEEISEKIIPTHPEVGVLPYEGNIVDLGDVFQCPGYNLDIVIDGDLFKAIISYPLYWES